MEKERTMIKLKDFIKNGIIYIGFVSISLIIVLNLIFSTRIYNGMSENILMNKNSFIFILSFIIIIIGIYYIISKVEKIQLKYKTKRIIFISLIIVYAISQILWINIRNANPNYDQYYVYETAIKLKDADESLIGNEYLQMYPQQISTASFYAIFLKLFNTTNVKILQYLNVIANVFTIIGLYFIAKYISNGNNKFSKVSFAIIAFTFTALPLLSIFIYGDLISLPFSVFAVYFAMKYGKENKNKYIIFSALCMSMAYFLRMNNLIFIIAIFIYLFLGLLAILPYKSKKKCIVKIIFIITFILISILPTTLFKNFMQDKLQLDKTKSYPTVGFLTIGSTYSTRGPGWYVDQFVNDWKNNGQDSTFLKERLYSNLTHFKENPIYFVSFYIKKIISMWVEPSFASLWYNLSFNFGNMALNAGTATQEQIEQYEKVDNYVYKVYNFIMVYEKIIVTLTFISIMLFILRNNKLSNEHVLLILIFLGGLSFHLLWEAKSRYVLPYFIILIPLATIGVVENKNYVKNRFIKLKKKIYNLKKKNI